MSVVPNKNLKSSDSLKLQTFGVELQILGALQQIDTFSRFTAFWKSCVIRNTQPADVLQYRTTPGDPLKTVQPNSELPVKGWGSFMQIVSAAASPEGIVEFECVNLKEAYRNA